MSVRHLSWFLFAYINMRSTKTTYIIRPLFLFVERGQNVEDTYIRVQLLHVHKEKTLHSFRMINLTRITHAHAHCTSWGNQKFLQFSNYVDFSPITHARDI